MRIHLLNVLLVIACAISLPASARQKKITVADSAEVDMVFTKVETAASTNARDWSLYMKTNTVLPDSLAKTIPAGTYKAVISFIIYKDGSLHEVKVATDPGYGLGERALRIFSGYKGKWTPAIQGGAAVKSYEKRPVVFVVPGNQSNYLL